MQKAICYIRVSPVEKHIGTLSAQAQAVRLEEYCASNGLDPMMVIQDDNIPSTIPLGERLGGRDLHQILSSAGVRYIIVLRLDRLFRTARDAWVQIKKWLEAGIHLHIVDMGGVSIRTDSDDGSHISGMLAGFAEMEHNIASERTSAALARKKANRFVYGKTPYGYDMDGDQLVPNEEEQRVIEMVKRWRTEGWSLRRIAGELNARHIPTKQSTSSRASTKWYASTVRYLLANPLYDET